MRIDKQTVLNPRQFVSGWFAKNNKTARDATRNPGMFSSLCLDYQQFYAIFRSRNPDVKTKPLPESMLLHAYNEFLYASLEQTTLQAMVPFECKVENLDLLQKWMTAVTGDSSPKHLAVMAHWVWMVKRRGFGLSVKHQVMPIIFGPQGGGKTVALEHLIRPLEEYRLAIAMHQLADSRVYEGFANHFVVVFDELQGIERTDMNALKKQITTNYNSYRKLHTHSVLSIPMRCSFIGATNKPVAESFNDSTGMRRFWEIVALPKLDWETISSLDYEELWRGINEKNENGYLTGEMLEAVAAEQQALVNKDDLEEFIEQSALATNESEPAEISAEALYEAYVHWTGRNGITNRLNSIWFGRKMSRRLKNHTKKNKFGIAKRTYFVNSLSFILDGHSDKTKVN